MTLYTATLDSPVGPLRVTVDEAGALIGLRFAAGDGRTASGAPEGQTAEAAVPDDANRCRHVRDQLGAYFAGSLRSFSITLAPSGTPFQRRVWSALLEVPYGETVSYGELAARFVGGRASARAVGRANGANPIPIIVPCHRVIGADGSLTGYGGGMARKKWLLEHEGALAADLFDQPPSRR